VKNGRKSNHGETVGRSAWLAKSLKWRFYHLASIDISVAVA
jgi:hypothetical protein